MNNYERIKTMSIEEMAKWLAIYNINSLCEYCLGCDSENEIGCEEGVKQWLQQEESEG